MSRLILTPGPTTIEEEIRSALARPTTNPDLDPEFAAFYRTVCNKIQQVWHTASDVLVLSGEGILGLEAAVASVVEPGDQVLCITNGVFGEGFADFVRRYGGEPLPVGSDYRRPMDPAEVEKVLHDNPAIKAATVVHCDTPAGLLNPVQELGPLFRRHGVISIIDAVASAPGDPVWADDWQLDIVLGGSQKCLSAPPGLTFLSISPAAWAAMERRTSPIPGFYVNLLEWKKQWLGEGVFPYTPPESDIYGLGAALDAVLAEGPAFSARHRHIAAATRAAVRQAGLEVYPVEGAEANTVTAVVMPDGADDAAFRRYLWEKYGVM
ncbi:MAG TPA: alanine--glyoxylate aminotransferase family protein, partial [Firmicutes bacterium]|nr:alanine--glyoxylate aminotransferase family protein [Bacillota bacterium]